MTVPRFGRITPLQGDILDLAGLACGIPEDLVQEQDRLDGMRRALASLRKQTGKDFGYDLGKWHRFLLASHKFREEYTFSYAWEAVSKAVDELLSDHDRLRLVELANRDRGETSLRSSLRRPEDAGA